MRCGKCCRLDGYVRVRPDEVKKIAHHLNLTVEDVRGRYMEPAARNGEEPEILLDHPNSTDCIFLRDGTECVVQPVKPEQCSTFPTSWSRSGANSYCAALRERRKKEK